MVGVWGRCTGTDRNTCSKDGGCLRRSTDGVGGQVGSAVRFCHGHVETMSCKSPRCGGNSRMCDRTVPLDQNGRLN